MSKAVDAVVEVVQGALSGAAVGAAAGALHGAVSSVNEQIAPGSNDEQGRQSVTANDHSSSDDLGTSTESGSETNRG
ncbi:MAG: hypothetical protein DMF63_05965 [Acidobacteria bacterium]|nr:MAG: hypothetical protein DMF63_05965 [Acidobacteriota bacterium]